MDRVKERFPNIYTLIDYYKGLITYLIKQRRNSITESFRNEVYAQGKTPETLGNNYLPIMLQRFEAKIVVQGILKTLLDEGYDVFGKHDSVLMKESDFDEVVKRVYEILDGILGAGWYTLDKPRPE